jgi:hypothetical protein
MTYSYTQISQYLGCPRRYRHRYLDGWQEKDQQAAMLFGRVFEKALAAFFRRQDPTVVLYEEWGRYQEESLDYTNGDSWDRMLRQGIQLLERLAQDNRIRIRQPRRNLQLRLDRRLANGSQFVAYIDAVGHLDGTRCLLEWKTTSSRYPEEPEGLLALDPQLLCYSWVSGIEDVALVAFVRKRIPEIQYHHAHISAAQREEFGELVENTIQQIEGAHFLPHSGIRFPQNGCLSCPFTGLCLENQELADSKLIRLPEAKNLDWLDQLDY